MKAVFVRSLAQLDGGYDAYSPATRACKHESLKHGAESSVGPFDTMMDYTIVKCWQCTKCGSCFASPRAINEALKKAGREYRWPSDAIVGNEKST